MALGEGPCPAALGRALELRAKVWLVSAGGKGGPRPHRAPGPGRLRTIPSHPSRGTPGRSSCVYCALLCPWPVAREAPAPPPWGDPMSVSPNDMRLEVRGLWSITKGQQHRRGEGGRNPGELPGRGGLETGLGGQARVQQMVVGSPDVTFPGPYPGLSPLPICSDPTGAPHVFLLEAAWAQLCVCRTPGA